MPSSTSVLRHLTRTPGPTAAPDLGRHLHLGASLGRPTPTATDRYQPRRERRRRGDALAGGLARAGARTTVVTDSTTPAAHDATVRIAHVGSARRGGLPLAGVASEVLRVRGGSVLHLHVDGLDDLFAMAAAALAHRGPVVLHVHGSPGAPLRSGETARVTHRLLGGPLEQQLVRRADLVVVGSDRLADGFTGSGARKVAVIAPAALPLPADLPPPSPRPSEGPAIVSFGALTAPRRPLVLVEALTHLDDDVTLTLVGNGPERLAVDRRARELGLADRVAVHPTASWATVADLLAHADVVASAALLGEDPGAVLLAMAAGTPVVATAVEGIPHVLTDGVDGLLVPPLEVDRLGRALADALGDPVTAAARAGSAQRRVTARGWDAVAGEVLAAMG